jgi:hypothetical protein
MVCQYFVLAYVAVWDKIYIIIENEGLMKQGPDAGLNGIRRIMRSMDLACGQLF